MQSVKEVAMPTFLVNLTRSRNELAHRVQDHIVELGLSADEFLVMWSAVEDERATAAAIRRRLGLRQSTFTSMVARLVARGYLRTRRSARDRRTRYLVPTLPGLQAVRTARSIHLALEDQAQPHDARQLHGGLSRLALLSSRLPEPILMEDGLPAITA
jgi:DNA-binding MarR family transcriptional regulator